MFSQHLMLFLHAQSSTMLADLAYKQERRDGSTLLLHQLCTVGVVSYWEMHEFPLAIIPATARNNSKRQTVHLLRY